MHSNIYVVNGRFQGALKMLDMKLQYMKLTNLLFVIFFGLCENKSENEIW